MTVLTIGSRGSQLALWQARWVQGRLEALGIGCSIQVIKTTGDKVGEVPLAQVGTKGLFTKEIEEALLEGRIDLAVHSLKDLPVRLPAGLTLAAIPEREDPRDVLVGRRLAELAVGARVGTSSLRREAQLRAVRPDLNLVPVRGNLETRLRKLAQGQYQALVLAAAGLKRLGWEERITEYLPVEMMCPAVGQGALAVETRQDGGEAERVCGWLDHAPSRAAVLAERAVLAALGGGCQVPIGAYAHLENDQLRLLAVVSSPDGSRIVRRQAIGPLTEALKLGEALAQELAATGAQEILEAVYGT